MGHLAQIFSATVLCTLVWFGSIAHAQEAQSNPPKTAGVTPSAISIELSTAEDVATACKLSFVVRNGHVGDVEQAVYETVLFDAAGQVSRLTLLDFQDLPAGRMRVRQFQFPQSCSDISRVLFNGAQTCAAPTLDKDACTRGLTLVSQAKMELLG